MTRVAVVTGAAAGIGSAIRDELVEEGWDVIAVDRQPMRCAGALTIDLSDPEALTSALANVPAVDALVNNAALQFYRTLLETSAEEWDAVLAVNLRAPFLCMRALARPLIAARGAIVNVSSVHATATSASIAAYAASKGGLSALTRAAAMEFAPHGVRVNEVVPGAVNTPALREGFDTRPGIEHSLVARTPLGRIAEPREIAQAVAFLLDPALSGFMTGQSIVVDGGALAHLSTE